MELHKDQLIIQPLADYPAEIGAAMWRLRDERARTLEALKDLPDDAPDLQATGLQNTIGSLLYHIAAVEIDWLNAEILVCDWTEEQTRLFPYPMRNLNGNLYEVKGVKMGEYLSRLKKTRQYVLDGFMTITIEDYRTARILEPYDVTPEWVVHHLIHHEAEHRGEIMTIRTLYKAAHQST